MAASGREHGNVVCLLHNRGAFLQYDSNECCANDDLSGRLVSIPYFTTVQNPNLLSFKRFLAMAAMRRFW
jgi:hypothetical protein